MTMRASGVVGLNGAYIHYGSQVNDDDIINDQIQADLDSQALLLQSGSAKETKKRRSRDVHESGTSGVDESPKKRRKEKDGMKRKESKDLDKLRESELDSGRDSPPRHAESLSKQTDVTIPTIRRDSGSPAIIGRVSLGSNRDALLRSITKGCKLSTPINVKLEHALHSEPDARDESTGVNISETLKTTPKAKSRQRVSMVPFLPEGYKPDLTGRKSRFPCPIDCCDKSYSRRSTLGEHMNTSHSGQRLRDNKDGTMSVISLREYEFAISSGNHETVVEIPDGLRSIKSTAASVRIPSSKQELDGPSNTEAIGDESVDADTTDEEGLTNSKKPDPRHKSVKPQMTPTVSKQTASKVGRVSSNIYYKIPKDELLKDGLPEVEVSEDEFSGDGNSGDAMEEWELDPGVIAGSSPNSDDDSETEHNIAYSSAYTTSAERGIKFSGVHFQVIRVVPGKIALCSNVPYVRICSVAAGKVQVKLADKQFSIGAHGMWRLRAGEKCTLLNRHYSDAIVHVSTINTG